MSDAHGVARDQLRAFIERIERLEEEKKTIADDIKDVYGEAKGMGFDTKILKKVVALRKKDEQERMERGSDPRHLPARARHDRVPAGRLIRLVSLICRQAAGAIRRLFLLRRTRRAKTFTVRSNQPKEKPPDRSSGFSIFR